MKPVESVDNALGLQTLPREILLMLPKFLDNLEDYVNLSSTSRLLRCCMAAADPHTILHLAWASSRIFFRPSPFFLCSAVAAQIGVWARESDANEVELVAGMPRGLDHLMDLALRHRQIGLTMERIRELYAMRFSVINPISDLIDKCVGKQWYSIPNFWSGGASDAATIRTNEEILIYVLAAYGELFGPDFEPLFDPALSSRKRLRIETRLEFVKYCIPDIHTERYQHDLQLPDGSYDPRRTIVVVEGGPYDDGKDQPQYYADDHAVALLWVMRSSRWRPHWIKARQDAGAKPDFANKLEERDNPDRDWRQDLLENVMQCQGMEALGMIRPGTEIAERYKPKIREWREKIERLEVEPPKIEVSGYETHEYPDLYGDLSVCTSDWW
ncbi:uncharacterized protein F4807DRAFT_454353 [Annulohypoxylon truncatum]|uniref:uncharacterized protein n=1 Tax=Annulohypoxylon truncatum TaxID=327061 RepID=UPI002008E8C7|nr:uncharacterized protein F4807DRAFT_454353 [Annulohypoxylon truncatum]KAI1204872.1 hypothetical protein F4807DRAFT_454353 [Annulohypoxylon truncatum]